MSKYAKMTQAMLESVQQTIDVQGMIKRGQSAEALQKLGDIKSSMAKIDEQLDQLQKKVEADSSD